MPRSERPPSVQFYPGDWMCDPGVLGLTWDQRGRYHWAWCCTLQTATPGMAPEDQWRRWMGYTAAEWEGAREAHAACFTVRGDGSWVQKRTVEGRASQSRRYKQSVKGGRARASGPRDSLGRLVSGLDSGLDKGKSIAGVSAPAQAQALPLPLGSTASVSRIERLAEISVEPPAASDLHRPAQDAPGQPVPIAGPLGRIMRSLTPAQAVEARDGPRADDPLPVPQAGALGPSRLELVRERVTHLKPDDKQRVYAFAWWLVRDGVGDPMLVAILDDAIRRLDAVKNLRAYYSRDGAARRALSAKTWEEEQTRWKIEDRQWLQRLRSNAPKETSEPVSPANGPERSA